MGTFRGTAVKTAVARSDVARLVGSSSCDTDGMDRALSSAAIKLPVQRQSCVDQRQMRECLREVTDLLARQRNLF
jgi:hypothetical protein